MQRTERRASAEAVAANGGYKIDLKQTAAGAGVLKAVQPGENTLVVRTTYNGRHRLREARDHGRLRVDFVS